MTNGTSLVLDDILDIDGLQSELESGFVRESHDPADPCKCVLCYTPQTQFQRHWNEITRACRGLSIMMDDPHTFGGAHVLARGIPKFFTMGDAKNGNDDNVLISLEDDDENVAQLQGITVDMGCSVHVADKIDGAMCVCYVTDDGAARMHTKGSFMSDEANAANRILEMAYDPKVVAATLAETHPGETAVFEVVTPEYPHIVDYGDTEELFLLGFVDNATGEWHPVKEHDPADTLGFPKPETLLDGTFGEMLTLEPRMNREGFVVTVKSDPQRLIKVKYEEFLKLQSLRNGIKQKRVDEIAANLLVETADYAERLTELYDLTRILPWVRRDLVGIEEDSAMAQRIADAALAQALPIAAKAACDFRDMRANVGIVWSLANNYGMFGGLDRNQAFVKATLTHAPGNLRGAIFATKKLYLNVDNYADRYEIQKEIDKTIAAIAVNNRPHK